MGPGGTGWMPEDAPEGPTSGGRKWLVSRRLSREELSYSSERVAESRTMSEAVFTVHPVFHLLVDLGWVDTDLGAPSSWPAAQRLMPNSQQLAQAELI